MSSQTGVVIWVYLFKLWLLTIVVTGMLLHPNGHMCTFKKYKLINVITNHDLIFMDEGGVMFYTQNTFKHSNIDIS